MLVLGAVGLGHKASGLPVQQQPASIIVFPKISVEANRDTVIQIVNTTNRPSYARCFYVNALGSCSVSAAACFDQSDCLGETCVQPLTQTEFSLVLTKQQPTFWTAASGRKAADAPPGLNSLVPALVAPFRGELLCVEVDASGAPVAGNSMIGGATLVDATGGDVARYSAIGFRGFDANAGNTLCLGGGVTTSCPMGAEFEATPQNWILEHLADGAEDPIIGAGSNVHTRLTVVPIAQDLVTQSPATVNVQFRVINEFESQFSASAPVSFYADRDLADFSAVLTFATLGTEHAQTRLQSTGGDNAGFVVVAQEIHETGDATPVVSSAGVNLSVDTDRSFGDQITLPDTLSPPPGVAEFTPQPGSLGDITAGPDGNLWFTAAFPSQIGRITTSGVIAEFPVPTPDSFPLGITAGPDGNLWFTEQDGNQIGRISTDGLSIAEFALPTAASGPARITTGPDGNLWFTESGANRIGRISTDGMSISEFPLAGTNAGLNDIVTGPDGNLWFTASNPGQIGHIAPNGSPIVLTRISGSPEDIVVGPDGNLWFTEAFVDQIGRITPSGTVTEYPILPNGPSNLIPTGITVGSDGNLWFTLRGLPGFGRITTAGTVTTLGSFSLGGTEITSGSDGNLWFIRSFPATIGRFTL